MTAMIRERQVDLARCAKLNYENAKKTPLILDHLYITLPRPPFTEADTQAMASRIYEYVWERSSAGIGFRASGAI